MLPKRLSRLPMCQPMEARLTHPQLPIQLVSFVLFYLGLLMFGFPFVCPPPSNLSLDFSFGLFQFLFSGFGWLTFVVLKRKKTDGFGFWGCFGRVWGDLFKLSTWFPFSVLVLI